MLGLYRYVLPGSILYGMVFYGSGDGWHWPTGSLGWSLCLRIYFAALLCVQSWIVGGTGLAQRWLAHYLQPWPEARRDPLFALLMGVVFILHGAIGYFIVRAFVPALLPYRAAVAVALGLVFTLPLMVGGADSVKR